MKEFQLFSTHGLAWTWLRACCSALALLMLTGGAYAHDPEVVEVKANVSFDDTALGIQQGLKAKMMMVPRQYHFHDMLSMADIEAEKMTTIATFHPRYGKRVYANDRTAFIELPLRIHIRETDDGVTIWYRKPSSTFAPYNGLADMGEELDTLFADVVGRVSN